MCAGTNRQTEERQEIEAWNHWKVRSTWSNRASEVDGEPRTRHCNHSKGCPTGTHDQKISITLHPRGTTFTLWCQLEDMFQLVVTPQGIEKVTIQLINTPTKVYAIGVRLFLSKVPLEVLQNWVVIQL